MTKNRKDLVELCYRLECIIEIDEYGIEQLETDTMIMAYLELIKLVERKRNES